MSSAARAPQTPGRSRLIAGLLSLIAPGVGHLYIGRRRRGFLLIAALLAIQILLLALAFVLPSSAVVLLAFALIVAAAYAGWFLFVLVDAVRLARRGDGSRPRWYVYLGAVAAVWLSVAASPLVVAAKGHLPWRTFSIPSSSMQPTLHLGEAVVSDTSYFAKHAPARGDVIFYRLPSDNSTIYVKRVVALGGERIAFREGHVILNGVATTESFADAGDPKAFYNTTAEVTVPPDHLFVAGDNRANSSDSRVKQHGFIPVKNLIARATEIFYTQDPERLGLWVGSPGR
jgi:signal peptidase I